MVKIRVLPAQEGLSIHGQSLLIQNKGDLEVGNPRFLLYIKNKTYSCTTIDFPQRHHLVKKSQTPDYQQVLILLHIYDILKGTISV